MKPYPCKQSLSGASTALLVRAEPYSYEQSLTRASIALPVQGQPYSCKQFEFNSTIVTIGLRENRNEPR
ncbi:unnamed protein product [Toxocara canis]|uniref:Uncharacterized protein n=1 Tax=Toxocara canis TaxID=6265 RepID=A0A183UK98_TOXCA|nr:unnamed protein product [Toxocara canis]